MKEAQISIPSKGTVTIFPYSLIYRQ